jgi:hypothetical protein
MGTFDTTGVHVASTTGFSYSYNLWDHEKTVGCKCDEGFFGTDCSERKCKYGVDPLFESEGKRISSEFNVYSDGSAGSFKLKMYDVFGEAYITEDIPYDASADMFCQAIDILPNGVFNMNRSPDSNLGTEHEEYENAAAIDYYTCDDSNLRTSACCTKVADGEWNVYLHNNPGPLKAPEFFVNINDKYTASVTGVSHISFVAGEFTDRFGTKLATSSQLLESRVLPFASFSGADLTMATTEAALADDALTALTYPALMKTEHEVFVATGWSTPDLTLADYRQITSDDTNVLGASFVFFSDVTLTASTAGVTQPSQGTNSWTMAADESLAKEDQFVYNNVLYTVNTASADGLTITTVENYGFAAASSSTVAYKVDFKGTTSGTSFEYATQCSNRGTCDYDSGICQCFAGYSNDNCDTQNAYAN